MVPIEYGVVRDQCLIFNKILCISQVKPQVSVLDRYCAFNGYDRKNKEKDNTGKEDTDMKIFSLDAVPPA